METQSIDENTTAHSKQEWEQPQVAFLMCLVVFQKDRNGSWYLTTTL